MFFTCCRNKSDPHPNHQRDRVVAKPGLHLEAEVFTHSLACSVRVHVIHTSNNFVSVGAGSIFDNNDKIVVVHGRKLRGGQSD